MTTPLVALSAQEGARRVALAYLDQAASATKHLDDDKALDALHDFRVGMRRLRSCLRAYDSVFGGDVSPKVRRRLKRVASATNPGRDSEVQLDWVMTVGDTEGAVEKHGVLWLADRLRTDKDHAYKHVRKDLLGEFKKIDGKLRSGISSYVVKHHVGVPSTGPRFGDVAADAISASLADLRAELGKVKGIEDEELAHRARIHGKRLRYLLEPFRVEVEGAKAVVKRLKAIQDLLGDLNDLHNLTATVGKALEESSLARAQRLREVAALADGSLEEELARDHEPGLIAMLKRIQTDRASMFESLLVDWLGDGGRLDALARDLEEVFDRMRGGAPPLEIERKYLLLGLPTSCEAHEAVAMEQGYLPGEKLIERVRRKRFADHEVRLRTVKLGTGITRIEVEEECSAEIFETLWGLTEGRRVQKRRFAIPDGELTWEIDDFLDRELVLAEVELPSEDTDVTIPEWLAPYLVREVTDESVYVNVNLAK